MLRKSALLTTLATTALLTACGGSQPAPAPAAPAEAPKAAAAAAEPAPAVTAAPEAAPVMDGAATPAPAAAPAPAETPAAAEAAASPAADGAADPQHQKLIGTKWKLGDFDVQFKDAKTVSLNGGPLTMMTGGKGLDASYSYANGALEVNAMGQTKKGTWDGEALVVDGTAATKQQ